MDNAHFDDKAVNAATDTIAAVGDLADDVKTRVDGLVNQTATAAGQAYGQARDQVRGAAAAVATSVEQQPAIALLVVGLVCGALGFLLARR
jgi:uncharacterized protein YjbJ (UPF0337 family)